MPLKCETCGRCHTRKSGCPKPWREQALQMAGPKPEPRDEPGEWVFVCGKHLNPFDECCDVYTGKWAWRGEPAPPDPLADLQRRARRCESHHVCPCGELRRVELEAALREIESKFPEPLHWQARELQSIARTALEER